MAKVKKTNRAGAGAEIRGRRPFEASALSGHEGSSGTGRMIPEDAENYRKADVSYTVKSYDTPIAWHDRRTGEWAVPNTKHSSTTSRHQSIVRGALDHFTDGHDNAKEQALWNS